MDVEIREVSKVDFIRLDIPILFEDQLTDRAFGVVSNGMSEYKIGWSSEGIKPSIAMINSTFCAIGIDLIFVIFNFNNGEVVLKLLLDYFFYGIKMHNNILYLITELEIIKIEISDLKVIRTYALPSYFKDIEFREGFVVVKCLDNDIVSIE